MCALLEYEAGALLDEEAERPGEPIKAAERNDKSSASSVRISSALPHVDRRGTRFTQGLAGRP